MRLRTLLTAAHATGWAHIVYSGSFGREHIWRRGDTQVAWEQDMLRLTISRRNRQALAGAERAYRQLVAAHVESVDQAVHLLAAYGLINCPHRERLARIQDGYDQINRTVADINEDVYARWQELRANNGVPIGGA